VVRTLLRRTCRRTDGCMHYMALETSFFMSLTAWNYNLFYARLDVLMAMKSPVTASWVLTPCSDVVGNQCFVGPWYLHLQAELKFWGIQRIASLFIVWTIPVICEVPTFLCWEQCCQTPLNPRAGWHVLWNGLRCDLRFSRRLRFKSLFWVLWNVATP